MHEARVFLQLSFEAREDFRIDAVEYLDRRGLVARWLHAHVQRCQATRSEPPDQPVAGNFDRTLAARVHARGERGMCRRGTMQVAAGETVVAIDLRPPWRYQQTPARQ
jgi:hypothetical protein